MSLLPDDPFKQLSSVRKEIDRLFSAFPLDMGFIDNMLGSFSGINVNLHETDTEVIASCEMPGLKKEDDIQINVEQNLLTIKGTVNSSTEIEEENIFRQERYAGGFYRSIFLPSPVSRDGVKAIYINGILEVRMKKTTQNIVQNIEIDFY